MRGEAEFEEKKGRDWLFWVGVTIVAVVVFLAAFGPNIAPYDPTLATMRVVVPPPSFTEWPGLFWGSVTGQLDQPPHWFGTDATGFDIFSRVISAPRVDLTIALAANGLSLCLGVFLGLIAGYFRNFLTEGVMRISDVLQSFPVFISAMILVALAGRSTGNIVIALALLYTPIYIRLTRSEVLSQRVRGYVEAARALGNPEIVVALRHVLPNSLAPALIQSSVTIGFAILLTAGLSFVGAGVRPPAPEWGLMISSGANQIILGEWWPSVFPGIAISLTVFGFAVLGTALERRYDA
ncbi:MAG: ABC transporter permease subunit [Rhodobacteraceae bacterium]|nr:ABC transporter permease subunit [Paracoccaceae bacterium]